jgi:hypothetical protein
MNFAPINAIVLVIKFDQKESTSFLSSAKDLYSAFGYDALKSLMLVCIQASDRLKMGDNEFKQCLYNSDGYKYLKEKKGNDLPYCLWDNIKPYPTQQQDFDNCFHHLQTYDKRSVSFSFQLIEKHIEVIELRNEIFSLKKKLKIN